MRVLSRHKLNQEMNKKTNKKLLKHRHKSATVRPTTQTVLEFPMPKEQKPGQVGLKKVETLKITMITKIGLTKVIESFGVRRLQMHHLRKCKLQ